MKFESFKIKKQKYFLSYYLIWLPFILVYQLTNRIHFIEPKNLSMTGLDQTIPFLPWTIPVYISYLVYTFIVISRSHDDEEVKDIFILTHIQLGLSALVFIFYPVSFPREAYYYSNSVTSGFNSFWIWFDAPNNCLPSLHTILSLTAIKYSWNKPKAWLYCSWGILIILSTLTCKQHYVVDIIAGFIVYWLSLKLFSLYCSWIPGKSPECPLSQTSQ